MSCSSRLCAVFSCDFVYNWKRPFYWIWYVLMVWNAFLMSSGAWFIRSVDTAVGTEKSFVNSEFQIAFVFALMPVMILGLFIAIATGSPLIRDAGHRVGEIIHSTPLRPSEYVWGKFLAAIASSMAVLVLFLMTLILLNDVIPNPAAAEIHGPFRIRNYLMPALVFFLPFVFFVAGACFAISEFTRKTFVVYLFPVVLLLLYNMFLLSWYPPDASPAFTAIMQYIDPSGFRWLKQNWLVVDRGVSFYNTGNIDYDWSFLLSRIAFVLAGFGFAGLSSWNFVRKHARTPDRKINAKQVVPAVVQSPAIASLQTALESRRERTGILRQTGTVFVFEMKELASQPWLYVFLVMIAILLVAPDRGGAGPLHLQQIYTSGLVATTSMLGLTIFVCFLLLFTNTESLHREMQTGLSALSYSAPVPTSAFVIGKALANLAVAAAAMLASFAGCALLIVTSNEAPLQISPFIRTWGYLLLPTFVFWSAFVAASYALTRSRMATYGVAFALLFVTGWAGINNEINWVTNWPLIGSIIWSDFGSFDLDSKAHLLNRLLYLSLAIALFAFAIRFFPRRARDLHAQRAPVSALKKLVTVSAFLIPPVALALGLWIQVEQGFEGRAARNAEKDYWRRNLATFVNEPLPYRTQIDMDIRFEPAKRAFHLNGSYEMVNRLEKPLYRIPLTGVGKWSNLKWTINGKSFVPENRSGMFVFNLAPPLQSQEKLSIGFSYDGTMLPGISRNGGFLGLGEFILPSGIVLTGRNPWFVPVLGYVDSVGVDDKNRYEPRDPGPHFFEGITDAGIDRSLLDTRIRIDVPDEYHALSMGVSVSEQTQNGRRITEWQSDYPVRVFNVVAARWTSKKGESSVIYYNPKHYYNIDSMLLALDSARKYYSEWFGPYVWKELRMSEFPALSMYARGNPTNIFFSEGIGFLTKDAEDVAGAFGLSAFGITAHEAAHQWWGHMLSPGDGPGGILLAEGMANFSTLCLVEKVKGDAERRMLARQIETYYGENRFVTSERPLARSEFFRPADETVIYDKGGWVFWMMMNHLGKGKMFEGLTSFISNWHKGPDHPVMQDFVAHMRNYSSNPQAYDEFVQQWIFEVKMPEYRFLTKPQKEKTQQGWQVKAQIKNVGNASMPVDIAAITGNKFKEPDAYKESRTNLEIKAGSEQEILLLCDFEPQSLVIDPDVQVFQLQRNAATFRFKD